MGCCCLVASAAGEFRAEPARGDGNDRFDVGLFVGLLGFGLCVAMGTDAER